MANAEVVSVEWEKIPALELRAGGKTALVLPGIGGNLISLKDGRTSYIRSPRSLGEYLELPEAYGIPVLFPPNFVEGARFQARGREYRLPINKPNNMHYHGFFFNRPWQVDRIAAQNGAAELTLSVRVAEGTEVFQWYPHTFSIRITYRLEAQGLFQDIVVENAGDSPLPLMLGFHTAFALPEEKNGREYRIQVDMGESVWKDLGFPANPAVEEFREGRLLHQGEPVFGHFLAEGRTLYNGRLRHGALIEERSTGARLRYLTDDAFSYWMIWNERGDDSFICIEPQTCAVNAANTHQEKDLNGFRMLAGKESFRAQNVFLIG
jgi:aldose 1-epimerase